MHAARVSLATVALAAVGLALGALVPTPAAAQAQRYTLIATVTRVTNLPMLVGLKLLEREDGISITVKDVRASEAAVVAVADAQGEFGLGFAPFFPAVEKGAKVVGIMELSRPETVIMAKKEIRTPKDLHGVRLGSHTPKASMHVLIENFLRQHPGVKPNIVFIPEGSPARAQALLQGALDAAGFDLTSARVVQTRAPDAFHILVDFTDFPVSNSFLIVHTDFAKKHPDVLQKVVRRILESYRRGQEDPRFWVREGQSFFKDLPPAALEDQVRAVAKIYDPNGGLGRMKGDGAVENLKFQVDSGLLSGPVTKWKLDRFFLTEPLEAAIAQIGRR